MSGDFSPLNPPVYDSPRHNVRTHYIGASSLPFDTPPDIPDIPDIQTHQDAWQPSLQTTHSPGTNKEIEMTTDLIGLPTRKERGFWKLWLSLTTPPPQSGSVLDARTRERQRRMHLLSLLLLITAIMLFAILPRSILSGIAYQILEPIVFGLIIIAICILLNRGGHLTLAGSLFVTGMFCAVAWSLISSPTGLDLWNRATFYIFVLPIITANILLPRRAAVLTWLATSLFIILDLLFERHASDLDAYITRVGLYGIVATPITIMAVVAAISWIAASSVDRALMEADRTQELKHAYQQLEHSNQLLETQKLRLEAAVTAIQQVHARAANGDLQVRASVKEGELAPLAASLNLMLERLSHSRAAEITLSETQRNIHKLAQTISQMEQGQFDQQVPQQDWGPLTAAAMHLEELRRTIVRRSQQSRTLTERIKTTSQGLVQITRYFLTMLRQSAATRLLVSRERAERIEWTQKELLNAIERLRHFLE